MENALTYNIRSGEMTDIPAIHEMIVELAEFEKAADKVANSIDQMKGEWEYYRTLVVESPEGEVIGFALFYFVYYTWVGKSLYLDDLYVKQAYRGHGIGRDLLDRVHRFAIDQGCKRLRWQVLDWNEPAISLYKKIGAHLDNEWINCDFQIGASDNIKTSHS